MINAIRELILRFYIIPIAILLIFGITIGILTIIEERKENEKHI